MDAAAVSAQPRHPVVFGVYRDGDNNLDAAQERNVTDFVSATAHDRALKVVAEDTTSLPRSQYGLGELRTESSIIEGGSQRIVRVTSPVDMSDRATLAGFVERTLEAKAADPKFASAGVWLDLVDHGGGDGGGLEADSSGGFMSIADMAGAIADGRARFRASHPGADDTVTGVVANQCLMSSLGFADALSRSGVRYLCASPETMLAPGVPSAKVAADLTDSSGSDWPQAVVDDTMRTRYGTDGYHPAAAFDVLDLDPKKMDAIRDSVTAFYAAVEALPRRGAGADGIAAVKSDIASIKGMARFDHSADMPWHADRPAIAVFDRVAADERVPQQVRDAAANASSAVRSIVLAHGESKFFGPFHTSYSDAAGPTAHLPTSRKSYDGWAEAGVSETHNDFFDAVDGRGLARAVGSYNAREDRAGELA
jgi:hypothetical protein